MGSLWGIFATQSNDFALGLPLLNALYGVTHPEYVSRVESHRPFIKVFKTGRGGGQRDVSGGHGKTECEGWKEGGRGEEGGRRMEAYPAYPHVLLQGSTTDKIPKYHTSFVPVSPSPRLPVSPSPRLRFSASPLLSFSSFSPSPLSLLLLFLCFSLFPGTPATSTCSDPSHSAS